MRNSWVSLAAGVVLGGLVGAGAMLLSAPQSGEQTRALIRTRSYELRDRAETGIQDTRSRAQEMVDRMRSQADEWTTRVYNRTQALPEETEIPSMN
jgi:gas vesicle protein